MYLPGLDFHQFGWLLNWIVKVTEYVAGCVSRRRAQRTAGTENRILDYINTTNEPSSVGIIWAEVFLKPVVQDVPFGIAFPSNVSGWNRLKLELRRLPYEIRHRWRVFTSLVPEETVTALLLKLLREQRVRYSPDTQRYSRLR